jgi:hypothetical protein
MHRAELLKPRDDAQDFGDPWKKAPWRFKNPK